MKNRDKVRNARQVNQAIQANSQTNKLYIAYGSNLNLGQMERRCPYAIPIGTAELTGYRLMFRGHLGNAVATVEPVRDSVSGSVPVLLWEITPRCEEALDRYEGWPHLYRKEVVAVDFGGKSVEAMVYIMNEVYPYGLPGDYYLGSITEGYTTAGFDTTVLDKAVAASTEARSDAAQCRACGCDVVWNSPRPDWPFCKDCMIDHCIHANCLACNYGEYPGCEFIEMKVRYRDEI